MALAGFVQVKYDDHIFNIYTNRWAPKYLYVSLIYDPLLLIDEQTILHRGAKLCIATCYCIIYLLITYGISK